MNFRCAVTDHPVETLAMRVDGGGVVRLLRRHRAGVAVDRLGPNVDVLLCEATFPESRAGEFAHLTASQAGAARTLVSPGSCYPPAPVGADRDLAYSERRQDVRRRRRDRHYPHEDRTMRNDGREPDELRPITFERDFTDAPAGSVLVSFGNTRVLCTASIDEDVPRWMKGRGKGWVTAEYSMLPGSSVERVRREVKEGRPSGRTQEIQRLIGRSLRAVCDMVALGERQVIVDCDVLQADGGTRTASICGGYLALHDALARLVQAGVISQHPLTRAVRRDLRRHRRRDCRCSISPTPRTPPPKST